MENQANRLMWLDSRHIWVSPNPNSGWRKHNANISKEEGYEAFNTLVWYCVTEWLEVGDYDSTEELLQAMEEYIDKLRYVK